MLDQLDTFLTCGYAHFNEPDLIDLSKFKITNVEVNDNLESNFTETELLMLNSFTEFISEKYIKPLYKNFDIVYCCVWDGVDMGSTAWHNDSVEGFDINVLYYFDDTNPLVGGSVEFRHPTGEHKIYPVAGDLVFINQNKKFFHKASRSTACRRVASIEYKVYE